MSFRGQDWLGKNDVTSGQANSTDMPPPPTNNVNKAEELTYLSTNIACGGAPLAVHVCSLYAVL